MRMNIFEGARRIRLILQFLWVGGTILMMSIWNEGGYAQVTYETYGPDLPFIRVTSSCDSPNAYAYINKKTNSGTDVQVTLCFKAIEFDKGQMLIPYKIDEHDKSKVWGAAWNSPIITNYAKLTASSFLIPNYNQKLLDEEANKNHWKQIKKETTIAIGGWVAVWVICAIIGWVIRGFMGIPRGQDASFPQTVSNEGIL